MGTGITFRNHKGSVSIEDHHNTIRLRWRYQRKRYALSLFHFNKHNLLQARKIALAIENDMVTGDFDLSLAKYRIGNMVVPPPREKTIVSLFEEWVTDYKNRDCETDKNYHTIRNMLLQWGPFRACDMLGKLNSQKINERTYNRRLAVLKCFMSWMVKHKMASKNYLEDVQTKKVKKISDPKRKPFSQSEIAQILFAIKNDTYSPQSSGYRHSHYYPFLYFLFKTGVRNAEAIGLRVHNIDYKKKCIQIKDVLARSFKGSHAAARIRKTTKNEKVRLLPMSDDLMELLRNQTNDKIGADLVFPSPRGLAIDDKMFQRRIFKKVLKELNIEERVLYACRHTFGSRCIENGLTPVATAFLMGNNPETALKNYTHQLSLPEALPSIHGHR